MGSIGTAEIIVVLIAALLILGPQKLPQAARQVGKAMAEFRRMANGFQSDIKEAFSEDADPPAYPESTLEPARFEPTDEPPVASVPPATPAEAELPSHLPPPPDDPTRN